MAEQSASFFGDLAHAVRSVVRTLLGAVVLIGVILLGAVLIAIGLVVAAFLWTGHKLRLIKDPPRAVFARWQMRFLQKMMAAKMAKMARNMQEQADRAQQDSASHPRAVDDDEIEAEEVDADDLENFRGSLDEFLKSRRG